MTDFAKELKSARIALGHKTARSFFTWLKQKGVSFNYSYYMRLEQGGVPSEKVTRELASVLSDDWSDRLILAHCRSIFPKSAYLFSANEGQETPVSEPPKSYSPGGQKELSLKQVAVIATSRNHYHLFLLATLARKLIGVKELKEWIPNKEVATTLRQLSAAGLVRITPDGFEAMAIEAKFPESYNRELKEAYARFDLWDEEFGTQFALDFLVNKMLIRRVSGRYLAIIRRQLDILFELVKSSDEIDTRFNDSVLQLKVVLRQGKLPG